MSRPEWEVFVLDPDRRRQGQIDAYTRLELTLRFNSVSAWSMQVDAAKDDRLQAGWAVEVVRNGTTVLSGPARRRQETLDNGRTLMSWSGVDWLHLLADRLVYPSASPFTADDYDDQTGPAETLIHHYVDVALGSTAETARQVAGLTFAADEARGTTLTARGRFQNLLTEMAKTARVGGDLGLRLVKDGTDLAFSVYEPTDRSADVVFSREMGNLIGYTHVVEAPTASYVIVGGSGTGTGRTFSQGGSADVPTWGRIEAFVDQSASNAAAVLDASRDDTLSVDGQHTMLQVELAQTTSVTWPDDYNLGDIVTVVAGGTTVVDIVREVAIVVDRDGEQVTPKVRTPGEADPTDPAIYARLTDVEARLLNLETG